MTEESNQSQNKGQSQTPPSTPPVSNKEGDNKINSESGRDNAPKETEPRFNFPQPLIIKEEKEEKSWWGKRTMSEFTSAIALLISIYAVTLNKCSLDNTTRSLTISDSTFKVNEKRFEEENRPIVQISDIKIESLKSGSMPIIKFRFINMGRLPAKVVDVKAVGYFEFPSKEGKIIDDVGENIMIANSGIANQATLGAQIKFTNEFLPSAIDRFIKREMFFYLNIRHKYESFSTRKVYHTFCVFKIGYSIPDFSIEGLRNEDY